MPPDVRPGDLIVGDEPKMNVLEKLMKHDQRTLRAPRSLAAWSL